MQNIKYKYAGIVLGLISAGLTQAQTNSDTRSSLLEEIVVTATKRGGQLIQDIPLTIQGISGDRLDEVGALDFNDYYRGIPGLSVDDQGSGDKTYMMRGINSAGVGTVGLYFDEVIVTGEFLQAGSGRQPDIKLFDMDRIEVLKGPQGTTFGSSSLSGTIRWIPNYPDLSAFAADVGANLRSSRHADGVSWTIDGMLNIPLIDDRLAVRLAALAVDHKGYINTRFQEGANNEDSDAARATLTFQATDDLTLSVLAMHQAFSSDGRNGYMDQQIDLPGSLLLNGEPVFKWFNNALTRELRNDRIDLYSVKGEYTRDWGVITGTANLLKRETDFYRDSSSEIEIITGFTFPAEGTGRSSLYQPQDREVASGELRFVSSWDGPLQVLLGGFVQKEDRDFRSAIPTVDAGTGRITGTSINLLDRREHVDVEEIATFGELTWQITDRLALTGGVRWFEFDLKSQSTAVSGFPGVPGSGPGPWLASSESDAIFKFNMAYDFTDDVLGYAIFSQGYRAGGTNDQVAASIVGLQIPPGFGSDSVDNYEIGVKSSLMSQRLVLNAAAYFVDWSDIQVRRLAVAPGGLNFAYRGNGGKAEVKGAELVMQAYPTDSLSFGATVGYTDAELTEDLPVAADGQAGDKIPYVPEYTFSLNGRYEFPLALGNSDWVGFISGDLSWTDSQTTDLRVGSVRFRETDHYSLSSVRAGVEGDNWSAILGVNNLFDEDATTAFTFNGSSQPPADVGYVPPGMVRPWPRTIYVTLRRSF